MLRLHLDTELPDDWTGLPPCLGHIQGDRCPASCLAHYRFGSPETSAVLLTLPWLPGAIRRSSWSNQLHDCAPTAGVSVRLFKLQWSFRDPDAEPIDTYGVFVNDAAGFGPTVRVLADREEAECLFAEVVADIEDDCDCLTTLRLRC